MSSLLRSSKFIRYFAGAARNLVASSRFSPETGQLKQFSIPSAPYLRCLATQATSAANQYSSNLERSLQQLDQDVRRTGRISRKELEDVLEELKQSKNATSSQSLLVIRCCGSLVPEELPEVRTKLVQEIWATLEKLKVPMDISHYNALLRVYLENEHNFSPAEFLQDLERKGVEPNRVTYQRLITRYCQQGDIEGATRILEFMREKSLPVNENVFNALIMGHSQSEDMESATGILSVMKQAGLEPSADTYTTLLVGHAKCGDMEKIRQILADCDKNEIYLLDKDHMDLVFALATNGHADEVDSILARMRKSAGFNQDAVSLILRLVNHGQEEVALKVLRIMPRPQRDDSDGAPVNQGFFFLRQLVKAQRPIESILSICRTMESEGLNNKALVAAVEAGLMHGNVETSVKLLKALQESGAPIRQHYFWPLFCAAGRARDDEKIMSVLEQMIEFNLSPGSETVREYVIPNLTVRDTDLIITMLKKAGVSPGIGANSLAFEYLQNGAIAEAANIASKYRAFYPPQLFRRPLTQAFLRTEDTSSYLNLIHLICEGLERNTSQGEDPEGGTFDRREVVSSLLVDLVISARGRPVHFKLILEGLLERGLGISSDGAEQIQAKLTGEQLTNEISELLAKLAGQELQAIQAVRTRVPNAAYVLDSEDNLKKRIAKAEETGQSSATLKKDLIMVHCRNQEVDKAVEVLKELGSEAGPGAHAFVIEAMTAAGRVEDAMDILKKLRAEHSDFALDAIKIVRLISALFQGDRIEEGIRLLEENKLERKYSDVSFMVKAAAFQALNILAEKGDVANLEKTFDLLVKNNYVEVTNVLLGPLIKVHVLKDDIQTAMNKLEEFVEKYKMTPWKNELTKKLIEAEDAASLQRLTDVSSKVHGEVNSLYDLVFGFVECGRIRQARKILETPGLRNRQQRLNFVCERYQQEGSVAVLEGLAEATKDMTHIDRSDIFNQLLTAHINNNDAEKALGLWTQMQEEDVQPSEAFLVKLGNFLESRGMAVPFVKPVVKEQPAGTKPVAERVEKPFFERGSQSPAFIGLKNAIRGHDLDSANSIKKDLESRGISIPVNDLSNLLEGLCQANRLEEAFDLGFSMLQNGGRIVLKHFRFFTNVLANAGETDKLIKIGEVINNETKKMVSFDNKLCGSYLSSGRASEYLDQLLKEAENATKDDVARLEEKFPRGAAGGIIEKHPELIPKFELIADKYVELGSRIPSNALWMVLFCKPELEDRAEKVWEKFELVREPRLMFQRIVTRARNTGEISLVDRLLARVKDTHVSEPARGIIHSCAIDVLVTREEPEKALERLKTILEDVSLENVHPSSLQRLQRALETRGKSFPYTIPPRKGKISSSSSSDDEAEEQGARK